MLSAIKRAREAHRAVVEQLYEDTCTIYEYQSIKDEETKITRKQEVAVLENQPCKLSFEGMAATTDNSEAAEQAIAIKLFLSPDIVIKAGSKIIVSHNGEMTAYSNSGVPGKFFTHQEIVLKLFERWA